MRFDRSGARRCASTLVLTGLLAISPSSGQIPEWQANRQVIDDQVNPAVARSPNGDLVMVWDSQLTDGDGRGVVMRRFSPNGTPLETQLLVNGTTVGDQSHPAVAIDGSGEILVIWEGRSTEDRFGVVGRRFGPNGIALGPEFQIESEITGYQINPQVARADDGTFAVAWQEIEFDRIELGRFDADGTPFGENIILPGAGHRTRDVTFAFAPNGEMILVWRDDQLLAQRYDLGGSPVGPVLSLVEEDITAAGQPVIAIAADGRYLVAWRTLVLDRRVAGQLISADDSLIGSNVVFHVEEPLWLEDITAVAESDGGFRVVWSAGSFNDPDGEPYDLYSRRLDASGQLVGAAETRLTFSIGDDSVLPRLAPTPGGGSVVVWQKRDQDRQGIFTDMPTTQPLFADGFESGGTSRWYLAAP